MGRKDKKVTKAKYAGETVYVHVKNKDYALVTRKDDGTGLFKVDTSDLK